MTTRIPDFSGYMHTYEAYKIPKDSELLKNEEIVGKGTTSVETEDGCVLVLTEKAGKQLMKDRNAYGEMMTMKVNQAVLESQEAGMEKYGEDMGKIMTVFRSMVKGDIVPPSDEKRLMDYDDKMYQAAKLAQTIARNEERKRRESQWDEKEEEAFREKMKELNENVEEAFQALGTGTKAFSEAQKANIVPIEISSAEIAQITSVVNLGGGLAGANIDFLA